MNKESIRFKFWELVKNELANKEIFILEANSEGEKIIIKNYIVFRDSTNKLTIKTYYWNSEHWVKVDSQKQLKLALDANLKSHFCKLYSGFNQNDVIITCFKNDSIESSEYFLYSTLCASDFKTILTE